MTPGADPYHPDVAYHRDGGYGGVGASRSVVGMVPVEVLARIRLYDPTLADERMLAALRADIRDGMGIHEPVQIRYSPDERWAVLGDGNVRLAAAEAEGIPYLPARVIRDYRYPKRMKEAGKGAAAEVRPIPDAPSDYTPSNIHPSYLDIE